MVSDFKSSYKVESKQPRIGLPKDRENLEIPKLDPHIYR